MTPPGYSKQQRSSTRVSLEHDSGMSIGQVSPLSRVISVSRRVVNGVRVGCLELGLELEKRFEVKASEPVSRLNKRDL